MPTIEEMEDQAARLTSQIAEAKRQKQLAEDSKTVFIPLRTGDGTPVLREVTWGAAKVLLDQPINVTTEGEADKKAEPGKKPWIGKRIVRKLVMKKKE